MPRRAQVIRVIMDELMRISSHMLFAGTFCMDLGATTMLFYTLREREKILQAIEEVKDAMEGMLAPEMKDEVLGTAEVLQTFHITRVGTIAGAIVREGKIKRSAKVRVIRDGIVIHTGDLGSLKRMKDDVKEVSSGYECGLNLATFNDVQVGDIIEAFETLEVKKHLQ